MNQASAFSIDNAQIEKIIDLNRDALVELIPIEEITNQPETSLDTPVSNTSNTINNDIEDKTEDKINNEVNEDVSNDASHDDVEKDESSEAQ